MAKRRNGVIVISWLMAYQWQYGWRLMAKAWRRRFISQPASNESVMANILAERKLAAASQCGAQLAAAAAGLALAAAS